MSIFSQPFLIASLERAAKSAAQAVVIYLGANEVSNAIEFDWSNLGGIALAGFILSVLTSVVSAPIGPDGPSVTGENLDPDAP